MPLSRGTETLGMSDIELLTAAEYARLRRCSLRTLDRERANRSGCPYVRLGGRVFYRRSDIERYIETLVRRHDGGEPYGIGRNHG
jgi:helix-turn-helix protein